MNKILKFYPLLISTIWTFVVGSFVVGETQEITWWTIAAIAYNQIGSYLLSYYFHGRTTSREMNRLILQNENQQQEIATLRKLFRRTAVLHPLDYDYVIINNRAIPMDGKLARRILEEEPYSGW